MQLGVRAHDRPTAPRAAAYSWRSSRIVSAVRCAAWRQWPVRSVVAASRFPQAEQVLLGRPETLAQTLELDRYDAAVVMSHHLPSDLAYLRALSGCDIPYVGLLGPANRREKLLADLGEDAGRLHGRLRSPIGLNIGGRAPESIALSIVSEIHARLHGAPGVPFENRERYHERV